MSDGPARKGKPRGNLPPLELQVPELLYRPGDEGDFSHLELKAACKDIQSSLRVFRPDMFAIPALRWCD
jgi:hypothetical protein